MGVMEPAAQMQRAPRHPGADHAGGFERAADLDARRQVHPRENGHVARPQAILHRLRGGRSMGGCFDLLGIGFAVHGADVRALGFRGRYNAF